MILDPCNGELLGWEIPRPIIEEGREFSGPCGRGGVVGWWFNSNAYVQGWGGTFQVPCKRLAESS